MGAQRSEGERPLEPIVLSAMTINGTTAGAQPTGRPLLRFGRSERDEGRDNDEQNGRDQTPDEEQEGQVLPVQTGSCSPAFVGGRRLERRRPVLAVAFVAPGAGTLSTAFILNPAVALADYGSRS
jgi:hypothetical protein